MRIPQQHPGRDRPAGKDSAALDYRSAAEALREDAESAAPIADDPITGLEFALIFSLALWALILSLGVAVFL